MGGTDSSIKGLYNIGIVCVRVCGRKSKEYKWVTRAKPFRSDWYDKDKGKRICLLHYILF